MLNFYTCIASTFIASTSHASPLLLYCWFPDTVSFSRQQAGIQDLTVEFPLTPYRGMGREAGYNAIYFWSVVHCWVKNVAIINADMAVTLDGTHFCTVRVCGLF
jgi:hypothetical protein